MRFAAALVTTGLVVVASSGAEQDLRLSRADYPVVSGSTSTYPLGMLIAGRVTETSVAWYSGGIAFTRAPYDPSKKLTPGDSRPPSAGFDLEAFRSSPETGPLFERTHHHGTSQSYARLADRQTELALTAREPTPEERAAIKKSGADAVVVPIARDAFVFVRNAKNPVTSLTLDQVRDIYAGAVRNWSAVGGADRPVTAYQREPTSGSQVEMEQIMRGRPMLAGQDLWTAYSMFGPFFALRTNEGGIGYSYHYYARYMNEERDVAMLAINGVQPHPSTIANGRYPLVTSVYLVHRSDLKPGSPAARLRDWLQTPAGQSVVAESGYVPLKNATR